jgi:hypothetical protein
LGEGGNGAEPALSACCSGQRFDLALCHRSRNRGVPSLAFHQLFHDSIELRFEAVRVEWRGAPLALDREPLERHSIFHAVSLQHEQQRSQVMRFLPQKYPLFVFSTRQPCASHSRRMASSYFRW